MAAATLRILVVEHNADQDNGLAAMLRRQIPAAADLDICPDIATAIATARRDDADLVLMDAQLARDHVADLCRHIAASPWTASVCVVSTDHNLTLPDELAELGVQGPVTVDELDGDSALDRLLASGRMKQPAAAETGVPADLMFAALRNLKNPLVICDGGGRIVLINAAARDMLRLDDAACKPGNPAPPIAAFEADPVRALASGELPLERALRGQRFDAIHLIHRCIRSAEERSVSVSGAPLRGADGGIRGAMLVLHEIDTAPPIPEELAFLSQQDSLTGVANREMFMDLLKRAIGRAEDSPGMLGLFFLDLDRFKQINDSLGHAIGDRLLAGVGKRLRERLRVGDIVGRLGGDEFAVLLENLASNTDAARIARKVIAELGQPFEFDGRQVHATPSIGIATYPACGHTADALLRAADEAMYRAKNDGRNTYHFYSETLDREIRRKADLEEALRGALGRGEFRLVYQPQYTLPERRLIGFDAQLRWRHPIQGEISPGEFVPLLEGVGVINAVSEWALACACLELSEWRRIQPDLRLSCRASPRLFQRRNIVDSLMRVLRNAGLPGDALEIEIDTRLLTSKAVDAAAALAAVRAEEINVALSDFGERGIAVKTLANLPVTKLKLHRALVAGLPGERASVAVADTMQKLAQTLDLDLAAEGVAEPDQLEWLLSRQWPVAQGRLLSPPLPALGVAELLRPSETGAA